MSDEHKLSEYIDSISFKKSFGMGFKPDEVYETICNLTSMYNEVLAEAYRENDELRQELINQKQSAPIIASYAAAPALPAEPLPEEELPEELESELPPVPPKQDQQKPAMDPRKLRRLKRADLLEILIEQSKENTRLKAELEETSDKAEQLQKQLRDRRIKISKAGTLAEATFLLNGVLESAQQAAQQYLENLPEVAAREGRQPTPAREAAAADAQVSQQLLEQTQKHCLELEVQTRKKCELMEQQANLAVEKKWKELSVRLEAFYDAHQGLRELLASTGQLPRV